MLLKDSLGKVIYVSPYITNFLPKVLTLIHKGF
uniref:Uncharacterized protein n=1 Tax=Staphylococcus phage 184DA TaxID=3110532 RepID=A0AAU6MXE2_9CAUD